MVDDDEVRRAGTLRSLAHPLRLRMLSMLVSEDLSASDIARRLDVSQALASYHVRRLVEGGHVELAEVGTGRGRERRYRYVDPEGPHLDAKDPDAHLAVFQAVMTETNRRALALDPDRKVLTVDAQLWVTQKDLEEAHARLAATARWLHERSGRSRGRTLVSLTALMFAMTDESGT